MLRLLNGIRNNSMLSWSFAVTTGVLFYYSYQLVRALVRPIIKLIPAEFYYDPQIGEAVGEVVFINVLESSIVAVLVAIATSFLLCSIFKKRAAIYGLASIAMFILLSALRLISQPTYAESEWVNWIKLIRPVIVGVIFWVVLWLMSKRNPCSS